MNYAKQQIKQNIIRDKQFEKGEICPVCQWAFVSCQCRFSGSAHPNRDLERKVVLDHLYLLSKKQLKHLIQLQKEECVSSSDDKYNKIFEKLKANSEKRK